MRNLGVVVPVALAFAGGLFGVSCASAADIPFGYAWPAEVLYGTLHVNNSFNNDSVDGGTIGVVNGTFHLDNHETNSKVDGATFNVNIAMDFTLKAVRLRIDPYVPGGGYQAGTWITICDQSHQQLTCPCPHAIKGCP